MTITVETSSGVGIHARYAIKQDGKLVATMDRGSSYRQPWTVYSAHYRESLGGLSKDINLAKDRAKTMQYPTAQEVYETICQRTETNRRNWMERQKAHAFAELAREAAAGSNSAIDRIIELSRAIEVYAKDRSDTDEKRRAEHEEQERISGIRSPIPWSNEPLYPDPPKAKVGAE